MIDSVSFHENSNIPFEDVLEKYQEFWKKFYNIPKFSPFSLTEETSNVVQNLQDLVIITSKIQYFNSNYLTQINKTYSEALDKLPPNKSEYPLQSEQDIKKYRSFLLGTLEESFTNLFQSREFGTLVSDLMGAYSEYSKILKNISNPYLASLNLSSKDDIDVLLKDVQELKREVRDLRKSIDIIMSEDNQVAK
ncbi:MAG TPA: poly(R)-hydroxyalkanoic acid synthase subunit PhaE [Nitrososphaeraceae archaeon]|nr:poly(R)-hydroxyalkanoic acid synthase subunit PhaE [Nitrososphaeraceae archaeon]